MRSLYRTQFALGKKSLADPEPTLESAAELVQKWISSRSQVTLPPGLEWRSNLEEISIGERRHLSLRWYDGPHGRAWAAQLRMPDVEADVEWQTEIVVTESPDGVVSFSCTSLVGRRGETLSPVYRPANRPTIVKDILSQFAGKGILPLTDHEIPCSAEAAPVLLKLLESPERHHPIVLVTTDALGQVETQAKDLAEKLAGLAYVIAATGPEVSAELGQYLSPQLNCFDAGVRLYWPGFTRDSVPFHHPLWTRPHIRSLNHIHETRLGFQILGRIAAVSAFTTPKSLISWAKVAEWQRAAAIDQARRDNRQDELITLFEDDNRALNAQIAQLQAALDEKSQEAAQQRARADSLEAALSSGNSSQAQAALIQNFESVPDALAQAEKDFSSQLAFCWNGKSEAHDSPFQKPQDVYLALQWLATTYHDSRTGKVPCPNREVSFRDAVPGWNYEPHQKKQTMKHPKFRAWYHAMYDGREFTLPEHFKWGSTKDARLSIRIAFNWDEQSKKIILGYIGQHQQTAAS